MGPAIEIPHAHSECMSLPHAGDVTVPSAVLEFIGAAGEATTGVEEINSRFYCGKAFTRSVRTSLCGQHLKALKQINQILVSSVLM